jgi:hypothetical protein
MKRTSIRAVAVGVITAFALLCLPRRAEAQFAFSTNLDGTLTVTGYTGPGDDVIIPSETNGLLVTAINSDNFFGVTISNLTIPYSITNIVGNSVALICYGLTNITVDPGNPTYSSSGGIMFDHDRTTLVEFPSAKGGGTYVIPNNVTAIGSGAFGRCTITNLTIPNSIVSIGDMAFYGCHLNNLTIPESVTTIGEDVFEGCGNFTSIIIPNSVTNLGGFAFYNCRGLTNVVFSANLTSIGDGTLEFCTALGRVVIPDSVTNIGSFAFGNCPSLADVTLGNSVAVIGRSAFMFCLLTNITIPASVTAIGQDAFYNGYNPVWLFFKGNMPTDGEIFTAWPFPIAYYLPGTSGWGTNFGGATAVLWNPQAQTTDASFGVHSNQFGFNITGTPDIPFVVEAATNLASSGWVQLQSCTLTNGSFYFSDPQWTNFSARFYRFSAP